MHHAGRDGPAALATLDLERVQDEVGVGRTVERTGAEVLDDRVQRLGQPRDLALAHPLDPELLDELLDPPGGDAGQVGVAITDTNACSALRRGCKSQSGK